MNKLVSIVIPVYNVEEYLHDCFYSVMNQKYTNLQIIAVNDGSTDNSLNILNEFSRQDKRIEVYSKKNGGLSDARNFGLKHIKGDYISFVDSDDVIDKDMISTLVNNIENYDADISVCGYTFVFNDKKFVKDKSCEVVVLNSEKSLDMLYDSNKYGNFVWNKLYKSSLFDNIEFPFGKKYEDIWIMHKLYAKAKKIVFTDCQLYDYYFRSKSILGEESIDATINYFEGMISRAESSISAGRIKYIARSLLNRIIKSQRLIYDKKIDIESRNKLNELCLFCIENYCTKQYLNRHEYCKLKLCSKFPKLFVFLYTFKNKIRRSSNPVLRLFSNSYIKIINK